MSSFYAMPPAPEAGVKPWIVMGSELSPYTLKVLSYFRFLNIPHRFYYRQGSFFGNLKIQLRKVGLVSGVLPLTAPDMSEDDEYPLVPFVFGPDGENLYDSSAIAHWLDQSGIPATRRTIPEKTRSDVQFIIRLIDEYADECGLYMVHHNRWKVSAIRNDAGARLASELRSIAAPAGPLIDLFFSARQTRRLPYLFSVAPEGFSAGEVIARRQPPSRSGFPATHDLLEEAFDRLLSALETIFAVHPFILGSCYTLADASIYGQLGINLTDPEAAEQIQQRAPHTFRWLNRIAAADFSGHNDESEPVLHDQLSALLCEIGRFFIPLMEQNSAAVLKEKSRAQKHFNEAAFDRGEALYSGMIGDHPFRSVAKTFQHRVWEELRNNFRKLPEEQRQALIAVCPELKIL